MPPPPPQTFAHTTAAFPPPSPLGSPRQMPARRGRARCRSGPPARPQTQWSGRRGTRTCSVGRRGTGRAPRWAACTFSGWRGARGTRAAWSRPTGRRPSTRGRVRRGCARRGCARGAASPRTREWRLFSEVSSVSNSGIKARLDKARKTKRQNNKTYRNVQSRC